MCRAIDLKTLKKIVFAERRILRGSIVHGHASVDHHQRPVHAGHATFRRLLGDQYS
jgi:hypothetical protein